MTIRVNSVICGIFHYRKYIGDYSRSGQLQAFYYSHRRSTTAETLGIVSGKAINLWLKEYLLASAYRLPAQWRAHDRIGPTVHRWWERQVLRRWIPCDLLHLHLLGTANRVLDRARSEGAVTMGEPVMCHPVTLDRILAEEHDLLGIPRQRLDLLFASLVEEIPKCDYLVAGSRAVRDSYVARGYPSDRIRAISYGVDATRFTPLSEAEKAACADGKFRVICVAQITPRKGIHYLLEAWARLGLPANESELLLVGPVAESLEPVMRRYAGSYTHLPHVPHERLRFYYGKSSVFVLPSVEDGFGLVTAEAMACGLPVVVSDAAGSADLVEHGVSGFVVPSRSAEAIMEALDTLYRDPERRVAMGRRSLALCGAHDWSAFASQLAAYHRDAVESRTGGVAAR